MILTQVDDLGRLWQVEDVFPQELLDRLLAIDWNGLPWNREDQQEMWARKSVTKESNPAILEASQYIADLHTALEDRFGITFNYKPNVNNTNWWVDQPGFTTPMHTDGELPMSMQLYFIGDSTLGTAFYKLGTKESIWKKFEFKPNTGYMMLNGKMPDGSQPLQWHDMMTPVPENSFRVSSYTVFPEYSHK